jgi:hypothetical protein
MVENEACRDWALKMLTMLLGTAENIPEQLLPYVETVLSARYLAIAARIPKPHGLRAIGLLASQRVEYDWLDTDSGKTPMKIAKECGLIENETLLQFYYDTVRVVIDDAERSDSEDQVDAPEQSD